VCILIVYTYFAELRDQPKRLQQVLLELLQLKRELQKELEEGEAWEEERRKLQHQRGGGQLRHMLSRASSCCRLTNMLSY
jgi:hypothetical protein